MEEIEIKTEKIQLDQFLKWANLVGSGGEAKHLIKSGRVIVNGVIETRRSYKLKPGDLLTIEGKKETFRVIKK